MDKIQFFINGFKFASGVINTENTILCYGDTYETPLEVFETYLNLLCEPCDKQLNIARAQLRLKKYQRLFAHCLRSGN